MLLHLVYFRIIVGDGDEVKQVELSRSQTKSRVPPVIQTTVNQVNYSS